MAYTLVNAEDRAAQFPHIPTRSDRERLRTGDYAKVVFDNGAELWVHVTLNIAGALCGRLVNEPMVDLNYGATIHFRPEHVVDIEHVRNRRRDWRFMR